jgi:hypothetical protein
MKIITSLSALFLIAAGGTSLIACGSSAPSKSSDRATSGSTTVGSAEEAIQKLRRDDADAVASCDDLVKKCESFAGDAGRGEDLCQKLGDHCEELAQQLQEARDAFEQCLEGVAQCEASAANPADCAAQRAACNPVGRDHDARRGQTLSCAARTESCLPRGPFARGGRDDSDAGANSCDADATDFVGCCHGRGHFGGGDAGPGQFGGLGRFGGRDADAGHFGGAFQGPRDPAMQGFGAGGARMTAKPPVDPRNARNQSDDAQDDGDNDGNNR